MPFKRKASSKKLRKKCGKKKRKRRLVKDPNEPKKPLSVFFLFSNEQRKFAQEKYPDLKPAEVFLYIWLCLGVCYY